MWVRSSSATVSPVPSSGTNSQAATYSGMPTPMHAQDDEPDPDERDVEVEVFGEAAGHAGDHPAARQIGGAGGPAPGSRG